jgi:glycosyltransferase involved in cell wall biosynthesis
VIFTGARDDIPDVLAALNVSVQCSLSENYGGTVESLLMARPTVATRVGGMPETVRHEETGLLVSPRDPPALAAAIMRLIEDPALGEELGRRGRQLMLECYTTEAMTEAVAGLYQELLDRQQPAAT